MPRAVAFVVPGQQVRPAVEYPLCRFLVVGGEPLAQLALEAPHDVLDACLTRGGYVLPSKPLEDPVAPVDDRSDHESISDVQAQLVVEDLHKIHIRYPALQGPALTLLRCRLSRGDRTREGLSLSPPFLVGTFLIGLFVPDAAELVAGESSRVSADALDGHGPLADHTVLGDVLLHERAVQEAGFQGGRSTCVAADLPILPALWRRQRFFAHPTAIVAQSHPQIMYMGIRFMCGQNTGDYIMRGN